MTDNKPAIIILAAGTSSRLGRPKQLLSYQNQTFISRLVIQAQTTATTVIVVTGATHEALAEALKDSPALLVQNPEWQQGMGSSISKGMGFLKSLNRAVSSVILAVCDQPYVTASLFNEMIAVQGRSGKKIVACTYADTIGTPVLFERSYFKALQQATGKEGAKHLVQTHQEDVALLPFPQGAIDIDTEEDYTALLSQH